MTDAKVDAWMPLWIGAYLADTMTLTTQQHGAYLLLLFAYWRNRGPLADDDQDLASIAKASPDEWIHLRKKLERFFVVEAGAWRHKRADAELKSAHEGRAKASEKASKAARAKWEKARSDANGISTSNAPSIAQAVPEQCPTPSPSSNTPQPPKGGRKGPTTLKAWAEAVKARGELLIPDGDPVFAYAESVGIPAEFLNLAWVVFKRRYTIQHPGKRYSDWRRVFRNAVEGNWLKLWYCDQDSRYALTTVGIQAQRALQEAA